MNLQEEGSLVSRHLRATSSVPRRVPVAFVGMLAGTLAATLFACSGRLSVPNASADAGQLVGMVIKGPVKFAKVTAYKADEAGTRGETLGTTMTDGTGAFSLSLPIYSGNILVAATDGQYSEEALGQPAKLNGELTALLPGVDTLASNPPVYVTPVSLWATSLASFWAGSQHQKLPDAVTTAYLHLNSALGNLDWRTVQPTDMNAATKGSVQVASDADRAGLILAALSQEALDIANRAGVTAGVGLTTMDLVSSLALDAADGVFDGVGKGSALRLPTTEQVLPASAPASATALDGQTLRGALAFALSEYLHNPNNITGLSFQDVQGLLNQLSSDADLLIFKGGGVPYDKLPPYVAFAPTPPLYTSSPSYTLNVLAADVGSGVAGVFAQTGASPAIQGALSDAGNVGTLPDGGCVFGLAGAEPDAGCVSASLFQFALTFPTPAHYPYTVYAVDNAGNNTQTNGTSLAFNITFDPAQPQISLNTSPGSASYKDESAMTFVESAPGVPVVPVQYAFPNSSPVVIAQSGTVTKAATRLSWGPTQPSVAQMRVQDFSTLNVPYLVYDVAYNAQTDSPITSMTYAVACSLHCPNGTQPAIGELQPDPAITSAAEFLLPLTTETIPWLSSAGPNSMVLEIVVTSVDGAGNTSTNSGAVVSFNVTGPPLSLAEDTGYASANDAHSEYPYKLANHSYAAVFAANATAFPDGHVRLARFLVRNAAAVPVGLLFTNDGDPRGGGNSWNALEEWDDDVEPMASWITGTADGNWVDQRGFTTSFNLSETTCDVGQWPCGNMSYATTRLTHAAGYGGTFTCDSSPAPSSRTNLAQSASSATPGFDYFINPQTGGAETSAQNASGYAVVPAATSSGPGQLVVYVDRPAASGRAVPLVWQALNSGPYAYEQYVEDTWEFSGAATCTDQNGSAEYAFIENGYRHLRLLSQAEATLAASIGLTTTGLAGGAAQGAPRAVVSQQDVSRTIQR